MVIITEPYQTAYINLISVKQNYSILILSYNPCNHCSRNCTMGKFASRHHSQSFIIEIVHYSIFCSECFILFIHGCMKKVQVLSADHFFSWIFQSRWKYWFWEALFIEAPFTQAQVSPGVTHNSLRGLSTQAILMGIPVPHTLGGPALAGYSAANTPFTKACSTTFVWWWYASRQDFILGTSLTQIETMFFNSG